MATRRSRLKPWPAWARDEYETAINTARVLSRDAKSALQLFEFGILDIQQIQALLTRLGQAGREAALVASRLETIRREENYRDERWPRWAIQALEALFDQGNTAAWKAEMAASAFRQNNRESLIRQLNGCLDAGQKIELMLLSGPPPDGVSLPPKDYEND